MTSFVVFKKKMSLQRSIRIKYKLNDRIFIAIALLGAILMVLPFLWMVSTSMRLASEAFALPPDFLPNRFSLENYLAVFESPIPFPLFFLNSLTITFFVTLGQLITCSLAAYGFARIKFPGKNSIFIIFLAGLMVPAQVTIIPLYIGMGLLGLVDTHLALILPALTSAFGIFLLRQFFLTLPGELEDSAKIDGASHWTIYRKIALPLAAPSLAALIVITYNSTWNSYFGPLIFLHSWEKMTLPLGLAALRGYMASGNLSVIMAGVTMAILPVFLVFLFAQRYFIEGLAKSVIKG